MQNVEETGIVCVCIFIGAFVRGVAGLGMAVVYMTTWIIFSVCQFDTGNLRHVVAALTLNILVGSFPLLYVFNSNKHGDYGITIPIVIFANIGCLIGTHLLETLPISKLQLALAIALSVVVLIRVVQQIKMVMKEQKKRAEEKRLDEQQKNDEIKVPLIEEDQEKNYVGKNLEENQQVLVQKNRGQRFLIGSRDALSQFGWVILLSLSGQVIFKKQPRTDFLTTFSITKNPKSCINSRTLQIEYSNAYINNLFWFSLAGFLSGFLGCLVGVPGPPIIIMFQLLPFQRDTVRVIATVIEVFTFRPMIFFLDGGLFEEDVAMYILSIVCMLVGMFIGSLLCDKVPQKWFVRIMDVLILVSTIVTYLKAFSLVPHH